MKLSQKKVIDLSISKADDNYFFQAFNLISHLFNKKVLNDSYHIKISIHADYARQFDGPLSKYPIDIFVCNYHLLIEYLDFVFQEIFGQSFLNNGWVLNLKFSDEDFISQMSILLNSFDLKAKAFFASDPIHTVLLQFSRFITICVYQSDNPVDVTDSTNLNDLAFGWRQLSNSLFHDEFRVISFFK